MSSPPPGRSILITRAPRSASRRVQYGPARTRVRSRTVSPSSGRSLTRSASRGGNAGVRGEAAVSYECGARDERGVVGGQEAHGGRDLVRGAGAAERGGRLEP